MCGIVGMVGVDSVNQDLFDALTIIQHRGQDAAGIMTSDSHRIYLRKAKGLVADAIRAQDMLRLKGHYGLGHVRYPTAGTTSSSESQPFYANCPYGIGLVHNGNLVNSDQLTHELRQNLRHLNTGSDSEVLLNVFAHELQQVGGLTLTPPELFAALERVGQRIRGAYSVIALLNGYGLLAFRDPYGIRPLCYGKRETETGSEYMVASETIALDALGFTRLGDVAPGEAIFIDVQGNVMRHQFASVQSHSPCLFEYIYLARADSVIDSIPVYQARLALGEHLAERIIADKRADDIDVVIPIPDTSRTAALSLAKKLNVNYCEGFVKNRYIGRTFIMPEQKTRRRSVKLKLSAIREQFQGKNVLLVDDSIVRGTTSQEIIQMARDVGANKVFFATTAPEVRFPNVYGIDMPIASELVAHNKSAAQVAKKIGADWLIYLDLPSVIDAINSAAPEGYVAIQRFEDSIFTGDYVTGGVDEEYLEQLATKRSDAAKKQRVAKDESGSLDGM